MDVLIVFAVLLIFIVFGNTSIIISQNKYAGHTPCENNDECEHLLNSTCEDGLCVCNGSKICEERNMRVVTKVGESCSEDDECNVDNGLCNSDKKCDCKEGYVKSTHAKTCLIISEGIGGSCEDSVQCYTKVAHSVCQGNKCICQQHTHEYKGSCYRDVDIGQNCSDSAECASIRFAECKNSKCACMEKYVENARGTRCLLIAEGVNSLCIDHAQCKKQIGGSSECKYGLCQCKELYQLKNSTNKCVRDMLLGDTCEYHSDCHGPYPGLSRLECILGVCECRSFYVEVDGYCISSSQNVHNISLLVIIIYHVSTLLAITNMFL